MGKSILSVLQEAIQAGKPIALATVIEGDGVGRKMVFGPNGEVHGTLGNESLDRVVLRDMSGELEAGRTGTRHYGLNGEAREEELTIFIESFAPPPQMLIFGAVDFTAALVRVAKVLGYHVIVCDARPVFATSTRFPLAVVAKTGLASLTHDNKFDVPAITAALATDVGYIGVMGSRKTHENRSNRLREAGVSDEEFKRIMSPIGSDIGARTPEETAISICAEIIALRTGRDANSLKQSSGPIHKPSDY